MKIGLPNPLNALKTVENAATNAVKSVETDTQKVGDSFQKDVKGVQQTLFPSADVQYDGKMVGANGKTYPPQTSLANVPPVTPTNGKHSGETTIYVNGIHDDKTVSTRRCSTSPTTPATTSLVFTTRPKECRSIYSVRGRQARQG